MTAPGGDNMIFDRDAAQEWLEIVYGTCNEKIHICSTLNWRGLVHSDIETALDHIQELHDGGAQGIYARVTTLATLPQDGRGSEADSQELVGLWGDIDIAGPGHKTTKPLPRNIDDALKVVEEAGLPEPTVWVHSGGGVYPWWLLQSPALINGEEGLDQAKVLSQGWQKLLAHGAEKLGFHYGTECGDLARVLRIPGTINRKEGLERPCVIESWGARSYSLGELEAFLIDGLEKIPPPPSQHEFQSAKAAQKATEVSGVLRPGDDFNERADWRSILIPHGWDWIFPRGQTWHLRRPGKTEGTSATIGHSTDGAERLYVFTSSTEFEPNVPYTKFAAYTLLEHRGDYAAASRALRALGFGSSPASSKFTSAAPPATRSGASAPGTAVASAVERETVDGEAVPVKNELPSPNNPTRVLASLIPRMDNTDGVTHMRFWRESWYCWRDTRWKECSESKLVNWLYAQTTGARYIDGRGEVKDWSPDRAKVGNLIHALGGYFLYRDEEEEPTPAIACANGVLDLRTRGMEPHHPSRFNLYSLPFEYDPQAQCPAWENFLDEVLPGDTQSQQFLQEWFGYVISGRTDLQKMASLVGPKRCGKGTIARVLIKLLGQEVTASPTLGQLSSNFGEEDLLGKNLAIMSDARWDEPRVSAAVAALLAIVGEDSRTVARKNRKSWNGKLDTRFMVMSNDSPKFADASGALAGRMIHIQFHTSFYGREDPTLSEKLYTELSGILNWALEGLDRLTERGKFICPESGASVDEEVREISNPVYMFAQDYLETTGNPDDEVDLAPLYAHYRQVCAREGRHEPQINNFSRMLTSALSDQNITTARVRTNNGPKKRVVRGVKLQGWVPTPPAWLIRDGYQPPLSGPGDANTG